MRWHYRDPLLAWLLVAAYATHVVEEWLGGFPEWLAFVAGRPLPRAAFVALNAVALGLMVAATRRAIVRESSAWLAIGIAAVLLINAALHVLGSLATGRYSPGLFTSVVLYVPLAALSLARAWEQAPRAVFWRGAAAGVLAHAAVSAAAFALTRI